MRALVTAFWLFLAGAAAAAAQDVTLSARDGSVTLSGTLLSYDGEFYRVETAFGPLTLDETSVFCDGPGCPDIADYVADLTWLGPAPLVHRLLPLWLADFAAAEAFEISQTEGAEGALVFELTDRTSGNPAGRVTATVASGTEALDRIASNTADFALTWRRMDTGRISRALDGGFDLMRSTGEGRVVGLDAVAAVVSPLNPVRQIGLDQLAAVLSGEIRDWSVLDGAEWPIRLTLPPAESAVWEAGAGWLDRPEAAGAHQEIAVARDPFALGLVTLSEAGAARPLRLAGPCGFATAPTADALRTDDYPLLLPIHLHHPPRRMSRLGRDLMRFIQSPAGQPALARAGFADLAMGRVPFADQGDRWADAVLTGAPAAGWDELGRMVTDLRSFDRLTLAFRFRDGSSALDSHSSANVALMAGAIAQGVHDGDDILIVGFSDGQGDAASNLRLSRQRARAVREALLAQLPPPTDALRDRIGVKGYGEASPIACDDVDWGRHLNRRVEVWVRQR